MFEFPEKYEDLAYTHCKNQVIIHHSSDRGHLGQSQLNQDVPFPQGHTVDPHP